MLFRLSSASPILFQWIGIILFGLLFFSLIPPPIGESVSVGDHLDFSPLINSLLNPDIRQTGLEHERLAGVLLPVKTGLEHYGRIPTWNPYMGTGEPIINNGFNYLLNPFHSLPILLFGAVQGSKLATFIALVLAGINMWMLAKVLGLNALARLTTAALYMMNGSIMGKFYIGHFQLALSLTWPPLVLAALFWTLKSRARFAPISFGLAYALLFFAGNIYYVLHTLIASALITLPYIISFRPISSPQPPPEQGDVLSGVARLQAAARFWSRFARHIHWDRLRRVLLAGAFAFGLAAPQFFPIWQTREFVIHPNQEINSDGSLRGSYGLDQAFVNFSAPWPDWNAGREEIEGYLTAVDYAYLGLVPFLMIVFAGAVWIITAARRRSLRFKTDPPSRMILIFSALTIMMMIWGTGQSPILEWLYGHIALLAEFRFLGRALAVAALGWVVLAGFAITFLWNVARNVWRTAPTFDRYDHIRLRRAVILAGLAWLYFVLYSAANTSTRQVMVLYNFRWLTALDALRFTTIEQAVSAFWGFILVAIALDTLLMLVEALIRRRVFRLESVGWRGAAARFSRIALAATVLVAVSNIMSVNSPLLDFQHVGMRMTAIYPDLQRQTVDAPFPSVSEPFSPLAFDGYEAGIRNWGLSEGWLPAVLPSSLQSVGFLPNLPRWAVVSNTFSGAAQEYAQRFVNDYDYLQHACYQVRPQSDTPCLLDSDHPGSILYEKPDVLPYAFIVPEELLLSNPASLDASHVFPAELIFHELDRISIQAATPGDSDRRRYYLIVQETNFPGWQVQIDGSSASLTSVITGTQGDSYRGFIAVPISPGMHTYRLYFEPPGLATGVWVFGVTLLGILAYIFRGRLLARIVGIKQYRRPKPPV